MCCDTAMVNNQGNIQIHENYRDRVVFFSYSGKRKHDVLPRRLKRWSELIVRQRNAETADDRDVVATPGEHYQGRNLLTGLCAVLCRSYVSRRSILNTLVQPSSKHVSPPVCLSVCVSAGVGWPRTTYITYDDLPVQPCRCISSYWYLISSATAFVSPVTIHLDCDHGSLTPEPAACCPCSRVAAAQLSSPWMWQDTTAWISIASFHQSPLRTDWLTDRQGTSTTGRQTEPLIMGDDIDDVTSP